MKNDMNDWDLEVPNNDMVICPKCVHQFRAIPVNVQHELADERKRREDAVRYDALCRALAGSWFYGNWTAETYNERMQEQMMRELGWWPITEDELVARGAAIDAAMSKD